MTAAPAPDGALPAPDVVGASARVRLDEVIHAPVRLSIVAALAATDEAEFGAVRDAVEVSDSALSKHASALEQAGYVAVRKGYVGKRPRTWLKLTPPGRDALAAHLAALRRIAGDV
ncbi:winged helix-turn-helix domain-containing protein [Cellulomonas cellasea]|uniref:ArsR family transcriptional regulator n=2 Tax=Cellulomonas cellasea TaxID=43670 RepID=A0A0A0BC83_9CELL|nr:transcriptional regulator [Cellulomonas cellasea]KGM02941.1 ArsR family transcriptional regulator [Cellulomonas cellasea DSM 20118]GEA89424.1 MarR family transcriptional regulator [Cellulomonas cellasea]